MKDSPHSALSPELKQEMDSLYRQGAREIPPARLDEEIRSLALRHLDTHQQPAAKRQGVRRFPYVISTAASLMLLVSLVLINPRFSFFGDSLPVPAESDMMGTSPAVLQESAPEAASGAQSAPAPAMMKMAPRQETMQMAAPANSDPAADALLQGDIDSRLDAIAAAIDAGDTVLARELTDTLELGRDKLTEAQRQRLDALARVIAN